MAPGGRDGALVRRYHHIGIPTTVNREGETHLPRFKMHVVDNGAPVELLQFDKDPAG